MERWRPITGHQDRGAERAVKLKLWEWQQMMRRIHASSTGDIPEKELVRLIERRQAEEELLARAMDKVGRALERQKAVVS